MEKRRGAKRRGREFGGGGDGITQREKLGKTNKKGMELLEGKERRKQEMQVRSRL